VYEDRSCDVLNIEYESQQVIAFKLTDITEDQCHELAHENGLGCYDNYKGIADNRYTCLTAKESVLSALKVNGVLFENKLGQKPEIKTDDYFLEYGNIKKLEAWLKEQINVWDINKCWIFQPIIL